MAIYTFVEINLEEAAKLADLTGILHDFHAVRALTLQLKIMLMSR